jgi:hypothetical protein
MRNSRYVTPHTTLHPRARRPSRRCISRKRAARFACFSRRRASQSCTSRGPRRRQRTRSTSSKSRFRCRRTCSSAIEATRPRRRHAPRLLRVAGGFAWSRRHGLRYRCGVIRVPCITKGTACCPGGPVPSGRAFLAVPGHRPPVPYTERTGRPPAATLRTKWLPAALLLHLTHELVAVMPCSHQFTTTSSCVRCARPTAAPRHQPWHIPPRHIPQPKTQPHLKPTSTRVR